MKALFIIVVFITALMAFGNWTFDGLTYAINNPDKIITMVFKY